jgi:hypothetical protein
MTALAMGILDSVRFEPVHLEAKTINPPLYQTDSRTVHPINFVGSSTESVGNFC